jgi:hypothetical protein
VPLKSGWHRWKKAFIALALLIVIVGGLVAALWATNALGWRAWRLQEVESFIGAALPQDANNIHFATQNQKTRIIWLRFDLPAENDLSTFLAALGLPTALHPGFTPFPALNPQESALSWWQPPTAGDYAGLYQNMGQKVIEILLDSDQHTVYLRAYTIGM